MALRRRILLTRLCFGIAFLIVLRLFFSSSSSTSISISIPHADSHAHSRSDDSRAHEIKERNFLERPDRLLNVQKHQFLQARIGRDEREGILADKVTNGMWDWWERFQLPYMMNRETSNMDAQHVVSAIDQLLSLNGWVAALCPSLVRPFAHQNKHGFEEGYTDIIKQDHLYYIAIVIHSADHFLLDQLAVIVQMSKRLGTHNLFVSMLDYSSTDSTETLTDLCEAVLTLLGVPFRIRRIPGITHDPRAAYYPLEEAYMRNLALEPLHELQERRGVLFKRVVWLKGFTCPNDILETIKVSLENEAALVCGMDWAENSGRFYFSDRWRTRDIEGDQFRQASSKGDSVPPRDQLGAARYARHLPFQVFCCEAGTHVVDPSQSYYKGLSYRAGTDFQNVTKGEGAPVRGSDAPCLDSSQAWFCRDLWVRSARDTLEEAGHARKQGGAAVLRKRDVVEVASNDPWMDDVKEKRDAAPAEGWQAQLNEKIEAEVKEDPEKRQQVKVQVKPEPIVVPVDTDKNVGSDYDAMPVDQGGEEVPLAFEPTNVPVPNSVFQPARILVNPRCVTTYAGVSHTQLAQDLFGETDNGLKGVKKYLLEGWEGAPDSFVCQEQKQTGGREATKTQRRLGFSIYEELKRKE